MKSIRKMLKLMLESWENYKPEDIEKILKSKPEREQFAIVNVAMIILVSRPDLGERIFKRLTEKKQEQLDC
jgi:hypothetical protein